MFGRKRLDELERKVRLLEDEERCLWATFRELQNGDFKIHTPEYGWIPIKETIGKLAKFAKKEEEAEKRKDDCFCKVDKPDYNDHVCAKLMQMCEGRGGISRDEILREIANEMKKHGAPDEDIARVQLACVYFADEGFRDALNKWVAEMAKQVTENGAERPE